MSEKKRFQCLRCDHRFLMDYNPRETVERACVKCGSNSVRPESAAAPAAASAPVDGTGSGKDSSTGG